MPSDIKPKYFFAALCLVAGLVACGDDDAGLEGADGGADATIVSDDTGVSAAACAEAETLPARITEDTTVGPGCVRLDRTSVREGAKLAIAAGTTVLVEAGGFLDVAGLGSGAALVAIGNESEPIVFTSAAASPQAGDWGCIRLAGGSSASELRHLTLEYAGQPCEATGARREAALEVDAAVRGIANVRVTDSAGHGVQVLHNGAMRGFDDNSFANNAKASILVSSAQVLALGVGHTFEDADDVVQIDTTFALKTSGTWRAQPVPYRVVGKMQVHGGAELTVEAGTQIQMTGGSFEVFTASIHVAGTADNPVIWTSAESSPLPGDWGCIYLDAPKGTSRFEYLDIRYAGNGEGCTGARYEASLVVRQSTKITNSSFSNSAGAAVMSTDDCDTAWCSNGFTDVGGSQVLCRRDQPLTCP